MNIVEVKISKKKLVTFAMFGVTLVATCIFFIYKEIMDFDVLFRGILIEQLTLLCLGTLFIATMIFLVTVIDDIYYQLYSQKYDESKEEILDIIFYEKAFHKYSESSGKKYANLIDFYNYMGNTHTNEGNDFEAREYYGKAFYLQLESFDNNHPEKIDCYHNILKTST